MKRLLFLAMTLIACNVSAQSLLDVYRKGKVKLTPEASYGEGNDWTNVFDSYNDYWTTPNLDTKKYAVDRMSIVLMPDGSVVVNHPKRLYASKFGPDGKFQAHFSITDKSGKTKENRNIKGIINRHFFTEADNMGQILCCDFNGNYVKTLKVNYMVRDIIPMTDSKLAVSGIVLWKGKTRILVSILDYNTNEEKIVWDTFQEDGTKLTIMIDENTDRDRSYFYERIKVPSFGYAAFDDGRNAGYPIIQYANNRLVVALPSSGEIRLYDASGKLQKSQQAEWLANSVSVEEQKEMLRNSIETYQKTALTDKVSKELAEEARKQIVTNLTERIEKINKPIVLPKFSNVLKDSDGNLLFFEFPKEKGRNKFNVWIFRDGGQFECQSSFECDEFDLSITPAKMVFHNGYIYALQKAKNVDGIPLRLVKFRLGN